MCPWMGSHFHNWIDYDGDAFSIRVSYWGGVAHVGIFWSKTVLHINSYQTYQNFCTVEEK